jgi:bifunctional non-homologous end joining protein LigD
VRRQLARYRSMRDFAATPEPRGDGGKTSAHLPFVVQKHAATRLHYDFRLGWRGVLKSWAVAKGPSYFPGDKRLAVEVEDHPIEYGGFEGTIPKGQYGGGTVMVWDFGEWTPLDDMDRGLREGHFKFELHGKKLKGHWTLVRMHDRRGNGSKPNWLLIKERDEFARPQSAEAITEEAPDSALTHRGLEQIAASADAVWDSQKGLQVGSGNGSHNGRKHSGAEAARAQRAATIKRRAGAPITPEGPRERFPRFVPPQLAQAATRAPTGSEWAHELKLDGYRVQMQIRSHGADERRGRETRLLTRKGLDWTARMPEIARAGSLLPVSDAILDGEVVALNDKGIASFAALQAAFQEGQKRFLVYYAFDLLHLDGHNTRELPLLERKVLLGQLLAHAREDDPIRLSEHLLEDGARVFAHACKLGAEGVVSKLTSAKYTSGRGTAWLKAKCVQEQELVIGGFTLPSKGGHGIGAVLLGYYEGGKLIYAGRSGTGFTEKTRRMLRTQLDAIVARTPVFREVPADARRGAHWVKPELVAQIAFANWTRDGLVRQASFKGLREDKSAREVVREAPAAAKPEQSRRSAARGESNAARKIRASSRGDSRGPEPKKKETRRKETKRKTMPTELHLTHPEKILDKASGMTKQDLAEYYAAVAEWMLPQVAGRPLSVVRCPEGSDRPCFFQKHVGRGLPAGVDSIAVPNRKTGKEEEFLTLSSAEGLTSLAQIGVLEVHPWGSRNESLDRPDRIVFDLDPDATVPFSALAETARALRRRLKDFQLESYLKSTGGKGLHVVTPIAPEHEWETIKRFAHVLVLEMEAEQPELYITKASKAERKKRIFLDYLRNDRESTSVAPYSPRARSGAPVAMTLNWNELKTTRMPAFHVMDLADWRKRLARDPWKEVGKEKQKLNAEALRAAATLEKMRRR